MGSRYLNDMRRSERIVFRAPARVLAAGPAPIEGRLIDMSESGVGMLVHEAIPAGTDCMIAFVPPGASSRQELNFLARVVYCCITDYGFRLGFRFVDMDSYSRTCINDILLEYRGFPPVIGTMNQAVRAAQSTARAVPSSAPAPACATVTEERA